MTAVPPSVRPATADDHQVARTGFAALLVGLGAVTLSFGGNDWKMYGWMMVFLALAAAQFSRAYWELTIARSASART